MIYCLRETPLENSPLGAHVAPDELKGNILEPHLKGDTEFANATPAHEIAEAAAQAGIELEAAALLDAAVAAEAAAAKESTNSAPYTADQIEMLSVREEPEADPEAEHEVVREEPVSEAP